MLPIERLRADEVPTWGIFAPSAADDPQRRTPVSRDGGRYGQLDISMPSERLEIMFLSGRRRRGCLSEVGLEWLWSQEAAGCSSASAPPPRRNLKMHVRQTDGSANCCAVRIDRAELNRQKGYVDVEAKVEKQKKESRTAQIC